MIKNIEKVKKSNKMRKQYLKKYIKNTEKYQKINNTTKICYIFAIKLLIMFEEKNIPKKVKKEFMDRWLS